MNKDKEKWDCPLIHGHLEVQPDGMVFPCCASLTPKALGNLHDSSLEELWAGDERKKVTQAFKEGLGKEVDHCQFCVLQEKRHLKSERVKESERWQAKGLSRKENSPGPISLGIRFSNLCNFSCRTCRPSASTSWFKDAKFINPKGVYKKIESSARENPLGRQVAKLLDKGLERLYFAGGEPLLEKDHYQLLEEIIAKGNAVQLEYDTNLSTLVLGDYDVIEMWKKIENVIVSVSLDGFGEKGEYLRKGMDWEMILKNLERIRKECPHVKIAVNYVLNNYNVFHLKDFKAMLDRESLFKEVIFNLSYCEDPEFLDIKVLPKILKDKLEKELILFPEAVAYLKSDSKEIPLEKFRSQVKLLDFLRGESFQKVFPREYDFYFSES